MKREPVRGEVCLADLGMAAKVRPVLVVSAALGDADYALVAVVPHTTSSHGSKYGVALRIPALKPGSFNLQGLLAVPTAKFIRHLVDLNLIQMQEINAALKRWLCLD